MPEIEAETTEQEVERLYMQASEHASEFVEEQARAILRKHPNLHEFIMGMGIWTFTRKKADDVDEHPTVEDEPLYISKSRLARFIAKWDEYLKITGEPMRFTADGPVVREW